MAVSGLKIKFWGNRSQVSMPGKASLKYGGNTACIQIIDDTNLIIIDSGFGINHLGETLFGKDYLNIHIFFTQFTWDHTQGLPFFLPIYFPHNTINLYSPHPAPVLQKQLDILFDPNYSPFEGLASMPANIRCHQIQSSCNINDTQVTFAKTTRGSRIAKQTALDAHAYKIRRGDQEVVIISDHEAKKNATNQELIKFASGADLLVHDAYYLLEKSEKSEAGGHSTAPEALANALAMKVGQCLLSGHAPRNLDKELDEAKAILSKEKKFSKLDFDFAKEFFEYPVGKQTTKAKAG